MIYDLVTLGRLTLNGQVSIKSICIFAFNIKTFQPNRTEIEKHYSVRGFFFSVCLRFAFRYSNRLRANAKTSINNWNRKHSIVRYVCMLARAFEDTRWSFGHSFVVGVVLFRFNNSFVSLFLFALQRLMSLSLHKMIVWHFKRAVYFWAFVKSRNGIDDTGWMLTVFQYLLNGKITNVVSFSFGSCSNQTCKTPSAQFTSYVRPIGMVCKMHEH